MEMLWRKISIALCWVRVLEKSGRGDGWSGRRVGPERVTLKHRGVYVDES